MMMKRPADAFESWWKEVGEDWWLFWRWLAKDPPIAAVGVGDAASLNTDFADVA